jgi:hypothetical protein
MKKYARQTTEDKIQSRTIRRVKGASQRHFAVPTLIFSALPLILRKIVVSIHNLNAEQVTQPYVSERHNMTYRRYPAPVNGPAHLFHANYRHSFG